MNWKLCLGCFSLSVVFFSCGTKQVTVLQSPAGKKIENRTSSPTHKGNSSQTTARPGTSMTGFTYIEQYKDIAIAEMYTYGIPASIKLAQAILESGNGNSYLAQQANNHFGIKCGGVWNGPSVRRPDDGPNDCFRVYKTPHESFRDHSEFLLRKRYEKLFALSKDDYKGWARGLKDAGYATNPRYAELLIDLIERYDLHQYDRSESYSAHQKREEKIEEIIQEKEITGVETPTEAIKKPVTMRIYEVKAQDTLYSIGRLVGLSAEEIKRLNSLDDDTVYAGQLLVVSK